MEEKVEWHDGDYFSTTSVFLYTDDGHHVILWFQFL